MASTQDIIETPETPETHETPETPETSTSSIDSDFPSFEDSTATFLRAVAASKIGHNVTTLNWQQVVNNFSARKHADFVLFLSNEDTPSSRLLMRMYKHNIRDKDEKFLKKCNAILTEYRTKADAQQMVIVGQ